MAGRAALLLALFLVTLEAGSRLALRVPSVEARLQGGGTVAGRKWVTLARARASNRSTFLDIPFVTFDPDLGWVPRAGHHDAAEGVTIDPQGRRLSAPPDQPRAAGAPVVALLGDSFTFGFEVADEATWSWRLAEETGAEIRNYGVLGYGLDQAVLRAERDVLPTGPDVVVLGFNTLMQLRCAGDWDAWAKPWFTVGHAGLVLNGVPVPPPQAFLQRPIRVHAFDALAAWRELLEPAALRRERLDAVTDGLFERLRAAVEQAGATLVVALFLPYEEYAHPNGTSQRAPLAWDRFDAWCAQERVRCVDLREPLIAAQSRGVPLTRGVHWSPEGHAVVAEALSVALRQQGLVASP